MQAEVSSAGVDLPLPPAALGLVVCVAAAVLVVATLAVLLKTKKNKHKRERKDAGRGRAGRLHEGRTQEAEQSQPDQKHPSQMPAPVKKGSSQISTPLPIQQQASRGPSPRPDYPVSRPPGRQAPVTPHGPASSRTPSAAPQRHVHLKDATIQESQA